MSEDSGQRQLAFIHLFSSACWDPFCCRCWVLSAVYFHTGACLQFLARAQCTGGADPQFHKSSLIGQQDALALNRASKRGLAYTCNSYVLAKAVVTRRHSAGGDMGGSAAAGAPLHSKELARNGERK